MSLRTFAQWAALALVGSAMAAMTVSPTAAHTVSVGYVVTGPGSVTFYYGTYHVNPGYTEGSISVSGPVSNTAGFTILTTTKPAGLIDGTNNFYSNGTSLVGTNPNPGLLPQAWQGVSFIGLPDGSYTFTYIPIASPTSVWEPNSNAIKTASLTISTGLAQVGRADARTQTVATISKFMGARNNQLLTNEPDVGRLVDRLAEAGGSSAPNEAGETTGFAPAASGPGLASSRVVDSSGLTDARARGMGVGTSPIGEAISAHAAVGSDPGMPGSPSAPALGGCGNGFTGVGINSDIATGQSGPIGALAAHFGKSGLPAAGSSLAGFGDSCALGSNGGGTVSVGGVRFNGTLDGAARVGFSTSLREMTRAAAEADARKATGAGMGLSARPGAQGASRPNPFDIWVEGRYASFSDNHNNADLSGRFGVLSVGADYVLSPSLLVGTMVQIDDMQQRSDSRGTDARGTGWMAGPYATLRLSRNLFLQVRGAWGQSSNKVSPFLTYTDNFSSSRWLVSSTLTGRWTDGAWVFRPSASVAYLEDASESYVNSLGLFIPSVKSTLGQAKAGPEIAYRFDLGHTVIEPRAGVQLIHNFAQDSTAAGFGQIGGEVIGPAGSRGRVEIGVRAITVGGIGLDISGTYDGIGSGSYNAFAGKVVARVPLN